jgi:hypothetical protein
MEKWFDVAALETERLLAEWLCPSRLSLVARNVFGELFLQDETGSVFWLNTTIGKLNKISNSYSEFLELAETDEKRQEWFVEREAMNYAQLGLIPGSTQCVGFGVPAVFAEGGAPLQLTLRISMSMFLFLETSKDKWQVCRMEVKCVSESFVQNLHHKAGFDRSVPVPRFPVTRAGSNGRCNTLQCVDSTMPS